MARYDCEICQGCGTISLPIYRRASVTPISAASIMEESSRRYPCPECSEAVPFARIGVIGAIQAVDTRIDDPKYIEHVKQSAARSLLGEIIKGGYVKTESAPPNNREMRQEFRVTLGVVSQKQVATLEERIAARQIEIANEVAEEASLQIGNWGSFYGHADILKRDAVQMVRDSIKTVVAKRAAWKPA